jgi:hypothetical protein
MELAESNQRAADELRRAGAGSTTAAQDAQDRADKHRKNAQCSSALSCAADVAGQIIFGFITGGTSSAK